MRYILIVLTIVLALITGTVLLFTRGGRDNNANLPKTIKTVDFAEKPGSSVTWTMQGRLVGDDQYREVRIKINRNERVIDVLEGYQGRIAKTSRFTNNQDAYRRFLKSLDNLGYGRQRDVLIKDEEGVCAQGNRFIYELNYGPDQTMRSWADTCRASNGTFAGVKDTVNALFKNQITDYNKFVSGVF